MTINPSLRDPDALHCMLLHAECGFDPANMAAVIGASVVDMERAMADARAGHATRCPFVNGSALSVSEADAPPPAHNPLRKPNELFPREWQRQCIMAMMIEGGAPAKVIAGILDRNGLVSAMSDRMGTLRTSLQKAGFGFQTVDTNKPTVRYQIVGDHRVNMMALMKNGWAAL
jgi:hypothetical protein